MEPGVLMSHSQELSNNLYPIHRVYAYFFKVLMLSSHLRLGLRKGLFPVGLPLKILKPLLLSSTVTTCTAHLYLQDLTTLTVLGERYILHGKNHLRIHS